MNGKWIATMIVGAAALAGAALYYFQVYYYYEEVATDAVEIRLTGLVSQTPEAIPVEGVQAIDASSSPIRFRACFTTPLSVAMLTETYLPYDHPEPLNAPEWFGCFDAAEIGAALEDGDAFAFMGVENIVYGIDQVVAFDADGRGFAWHQINPCGEKAFDGDPVPEGCPAPPVSE